MSRRRNSTYVRMINLAGFAAILGVRLDEMDLIRELPGFPRAELNPGEPESDEELWGADVPLAWLEDQTQLMQLQLSRMNVLLKQATMATKELL